MKQRQFRKLLAFALSCTVMTAGVPRLPLLNEGLTEAAQSVQGFMAQLSAMQQSRQQSEPFAQLRYDKKEKTLYRDGIEVGKEFAGFAVSENRLVLRADAAVGSAEGKAQQKVLTLEEAAAQIGCEVQEDAEGITVTSPFASGRLIVKSKGAVDRKNAIDVVENFRDLHVLQFATASDAYAAYLEYLEDEDVIFAEPSRTAHIAKDAENAASYAELYEQIVTEAQTKAVDPAEASWGYDAIGAGQYNEWLTSTYETLPEITVAVIDTGLNYDHVWFENRIDDRGALLMTDDRYEGLPNDDHGHGSHCAGIICSVTTENVKIMPIKVLDDAGYGDILNIYCGMLYALEQKADVISMSLGINGDSPLVNEAADLIAEADIPCCVAAGNDTMDAEYFSPARHEASITVAATDQYGDTAYFSNYGEKIDFAAPGVDINSAAHDSIDGLELKSGTSMATPYVAGCCAMLLSTNPELPTDTLYDYLKANATDCGESGFDTQYGWGIVQMADFRFTDIVCAKPMADYEGGYYNDAVIVSLSTDTEGAVIYYTLDGTMPDRETGMRYQTPLTITESTKLQAVAYCEDVASDVMTENYILHGRDLADPYEIDSNGVLLAYRGVLIAPDLTQVSFDVPLTAVGEGAFAENTDLVMVTLPQTVTSIGRRAFADCPYLDTVICEGVTSIGEEAFKGDSELVMLHTASLTKLGAGSFDGCSALEEVELADTLTEIPARAFRDCYLLTTVSIPNVTVVGESAWQFCTMLQLEAVDWNSMTAIGDHAFANCIQLKDDVTLPSIETLGKYAFECSGITGITLPEQLTVIPEGLLLDCSMIERISAPGVTKIENYGLAAGSVFSGIVPDCELDYANITEIGEGGMVGFYFAEEAVFSSLTEMGSLAFAMTSGAALSLPLLEIAKTDDFAMVMTDAIYLKSLKVMESAAMSLCSAVIVGEQCESFAKDAMVMCDSLAGPAGSAAESYAKQIDLPFYPTPSLYVSEQAYSWPSYVECPIVLIPMAFDTHCQWYLLDPETETASAIADGTSFDYQPDVPADVETWYRVEMLDETGTVLDSVEFSVLQQSFVTVGELREDEYYFWDYKAMKEEAAAAIQQGMESYEATVLRHYRFTPETDGTYYFYNMCDQSTVMVSLSENGVPLETCNYDSFYYDQMLSAELKAGCEYVCSIELYGYSDFVGATVVSQINPNKCLNFADVECESWTTEYYDDSYPFEPDFTFYDWNVEEYLVEGVDYVLIMIENDQSGTIYTYPFGIGAYRGRGSAIATYLVKQAPMDTPLLVQFSEDEDYMSYQFIPTVSGEYRIFSCVTETMISQGDEGALYSVDPYLEIYDETNALWDLADDTFYSYHFDTTLYLEEGVRYSLHCGNYDYGASEYVVYITQEKQPITLGYIETESDSYYYNGTPVIPQDVMVYDENDVLLTENVDYTLEVYGNDRFGTMYLVVNGIGKYLGTLYTTRTLLPGDADENMTKIEIGVPFDDPGEDVLYALTIEESDYYCLVSADGSGDWVDAVLYEKGIGTTIIVDIFATYIPSGTYYLSIGENSSGGSIILRKYQDITDAEIIVDNLFFNGELQSPNVVVKMGDTVLVEDQDYILDGDVEVDAYGKYEIEIIGIGTYSGIAYVTYYVLPPLHPTERYITEGLNIVTIPECAVKEGFIWEPAQSGSYCISNSDIKDVDIYVIDDAGALVAEVSGLHENYTICEVDAGKTYYISVGFRNPGEFGLCHVRIDYGRQPLDEAVAGIDYASYIPYGEGEMIPELTLYDSSDEPLIEGVDYEIYTIGNYGVVGQACVYLRGLGDYIGMMEVPYVVYHPDLFALEEDENISFIDLEYDIEETIYADYPNHAGVYCFTAEKTDVYALEVSDYDGISVVIPYDENGCFLEDLDLNGFMLNAGESIYFYCGVTGIHVDFLRFYSFMITAGEVIEYYEYDGVTYAVYNDYAEIIELDPSRYGYEIPEYVMHPTLQIPVPVEDISFALVADDTSYQKIFYVPMYSTISYLLESWGFYIVPIEAESEVLGDITGDGYLDFTDYYALICFITECEGVYLKPSQIASADINGDGLIDLSDAQQLLTILSSAVYG